MLSIEAFIVSRMGIVTVAHNSDAVLPEFFDSVLSQTYEDYLLYVVDSGSTDGTQDRLRAISDPRLRCVLRQENIGFAAGSNLGIRMALKEGCESVMLLNNDTAFGPHLFQQLSDGLDRYNCDMTTPKMLYYETPNKIWAAGGHLNRWLGYRQRHDGENRQDDGRFDAPRRVTFTPFCCILIQSSVFEKIGYLDEAYFVYVEDVDYCYRAYRAYLSIWYLPHCRLFHKVNSLTGHMSDFMVRYCTRNRIYYLQKHLPRLQAFFWYAIYHVHYAIDYLWRRTPRKRWDLRRTSANEGWRMRQKIGIAQPQAGKAKT